MSIAIDTIRRAGARDYVMVVSCLGSDCVAQRPHPEVSRHCAVRARRARRRARSGHTESAE